MQAIAFLTSLRVTDMNYNLKPWRTIVWKTKAGVIVKKPCTCTNRIPGLEAEGCLDCRIWWLDEQVLEQVTKRNRKSKRNKKQPDEEWL
jgi:hypothetical protein